MNRNLPSGPSKKALRSEDEKVSKAFNAWMQDFVNDPEKFNSTAGSALKFMRERLRAPRRLTAMSVRRRCAYLDAAA